jgi:hypothetical protein
MANPDKTQTNFEKSKARAEADSAAAKMKTEAKIAKANAKLQITDAQDAADIDVATKRAAAQHEKSASEQHDK